MEVQKLRKSIEEEYGGSNCRDIPRRMHGRTFVLTDPKELANT
jgi:hypothetical protein